MAYDNNNVFAKILRGEIPAVKVYEDERSFAFMDVMPEADGHVLVVPKEPAVDILDLSAAGLSALMATVQKVAKAVDMALKPDGILIKQYNRAAAAYTEPRSRRKLPSSSSASSPPSPALMTMPNSRVLFRLMRMSAAPAGAPASKARPSPSSSAFSSPASSAPRPCPAAWRNSSLARVVMDLLTIPSSR